MTQMGHAVVGILWRFTICGAGSARSAMQFGVASEPGKGSVFTVRLPGSASSYPKEAK